MDPEPRAIETARSRAGASGHNKIEVILATDDEMPVASELMSAWPVGKAVGNVKNDTTDLIERTHVQVSAI
jgi:hypothetical protein